MKGNRMKMWRTWMAIAVFTFGGLEGRAAIAKSGCGTVAQPIASAAITSEPEPREEPEFVFDGDDTGAVGEEVRFTVKAMNMENPMVIFEGNYGAPDDSRLTTDCIVFEDGVCTFTPDVAGEYWFEFSAYDGYDFGICAKWTVRIFPMPTPAGMQMLFFNANGGTCNTRYDWYPVGESYTFLPEALRDGYEFLGWFTSAIGGVQVTESDIVSATLERTCYAHWSLVPGEEDPLISILPPTRNFGIEGGGGAIIVSGTGTWTASVSDSWITLNVASGKAGYPVAYTVSATTNAEGRAGYIYVSGYVHTVTQDGLGGGHLTGERNI